jgi:tetrahydrodipicolinate N-succinyltransferase
VLHTVRNVSAQEPGVGVRQEVVNGVSLGDRTIILQGVDVVICRTNTQLRLKKTGSDKLESRGNDQLLGLERRSTGHAHPSKPAI